jgi:hypothetical protein
MNPTITRILVSALASFATALPLALAQTQELHPAPLLLDMVHHNPGEARYETKYEDPAVIRAMGNNGKVYFLFDSPMLAVDRESIDPDIFPKGSPGRVWVDAKAAQIDAQHAACAATGVKIYAMSDLVLFPKTLVEKHQLAKTFGDPRHPETQKYLRLLIGQMFQRFPKLDGLVVRIGQWEEIVRLAGEIRFREAATTESVVTSARYGLCLYRIYRAAFHLASEGTLGDKTRIRTLLSDYDRAWEDYRNLAKEHPECATLYREQGSPWGPKPGIDEFIQGYRKAVGTFQ